MTESGWETDSHRSFSVLSRTAVKFGGMFFRFLPIVLLLSACDSPASTSPDKPDVADLDTFKRKPLSLGSQTYSLPVGSDGFLQGSSQGANWGFDALTWNATVGQIGSVAAIERAAFAVTIRSDLLSASQKATWPSDLRGKSVSRKMMQPAKVDEIEFFRDVTESVPNPPFYLFPEGLDGYVRCSSYNGSPLVSDCRLVVRDGDVVHSLPIAEGQLGLANDVSRVFLAKIKG